MADSIQDAFERLSTNAPLPGVGPYIFQGGSRYDGTVVVNGGSLHQGNVINIHQAADRCLADLCVTDPSRDKTRIEDTKGGLLKDSYNWVLDNSDFSQWRDDGDHRLLWVKGDPGKGKTMLLCGIIDHLEATLWYEQKVFYFFCQANDERINNAVAVLRGLMFMTASEYPFLLSYIKTQYDKAGKNLFEDKNAWQSLSKIFMKMLQHPQLQGAYFIVDALDECVTGLPQLLDLIVLASAQTGSRWLISSRNWPQIEDRLRSVNSRLSLELNAQSVSAAVEYYIGFKVSQLAQEKGYDSETQDEVCRYLSANANGTFLWVALVCQALEKSYRWNVLQIVKSFAPGLDDIYARMMQSIRYSENAELCRQVLAVVSTSYRPLSLAELTTLIDGPRETIDNVEFVQDVISLSGSFLTIRENTVYLVHQSARDFLIDKKQSSFLFSQGQAEIHHWIFSRSVEAMQRLLRRDMYQLRKPGFCIEDVCRPTPDPLAGIAYSCVHWVNHLVDSGRGSNEDAEVVNEFFWSVSLYWLESLSLLRSVSEGIYALKRLQDYLEPEPSQARVLVHDTYRLILSFRSVIESRPLQTYASVLLFSPTQSLIRGLFQHEKPGWVECTRGIDEQWGASVATLEGHGDKVHSAAFSPDGRLVASASDDKTVKIWDARTGVCTATLEGHVGSVYSVAFSPDGRHVVFASEDHVIKIWDATTGGACTATLEGHGGSVYSAVFSADGQLIVSASHDRTIKIWNAHTGACTATLEGHRDCIISAAFSANGRRIVSSSDDCNVKIWDTRTGACKATLEGHKSSVYSAAFSADGQRIVSASDDCSVKIWDARTGACKATLEGHKSSVYSAAFSPNGQSIVSASGDCSVKIWDASTGSCRSTLKGHGYSVSSVSFSTDGQRIISASEDDTVRIWDASRNLSRSTHKGHKGSVYAAAFSADGQRVMSISNNQTAKIWDARTGACAGTLNIAWPGAYTVTLSADGQRAILPLRDGKIQTWIPSTGRSSKLYTYFERDASCVVLSADERHIAEALGNNTIRISQFSSEISQLVFDKHPRNMITTLMGHNGSITSMEFSTDGRRVVSASEDDTIKIWDARKGTCMATYKASQISCLSFDTTGRYIHTNKGVIRVGETSRAKVDDVPKLAQFENYTLSLDEAWVLYRSEPVLWLPAEYRPNCSGWATMDNGMSLVLGYVSGQVLIMRFTI